MNKIELIIELYKSSNVPTAVTDKDFEIVWTNDATIGSSLSVYKSIKDAALRTVGAKDKLLSGQPALLDVFDNFANLSFYSATPLDDFFIIQPVKSKSVTENASYATANMREHLSEIFTLLPVLFAKTEQDLDTVRCYELLNRSCYETLRLVTNIETMSKLNGSEMNFQREIVEVGDLCRRLCDGVSSVCTEKKLNIDFSANPSDLAVMCDATALSVAFLNLLHNAMMFSEDGDSLFIKVKKIGKSVVISVRDTGKGIREEILPMVFEPYFSANPTEENLIRPGAGLGLSIVKSFVLRYKGSYSIVSEEDSGTTVTITLPICDDFDDKVFVHTELAEYLTNRFSVLYIQMARFIRL